MFILFIFYCTVDCTFKNIEECYVGCMAVDRVGTNIELYNPKNCFFTHYLTGDYKTLNYGYLDAKNRFIKFTGEVTKDTYAHYKSTVPTFNLTRYINTLTTYKIITS